jgi:hypothetical protein
MLPEELTEFPDLPGMKTGIAHNDFRQYPVVLRQNTKKFRFGLPNGLRDQTLPINPREPVIARRLLSNVKKAAKLQVQFALNRTEPKRIPTHSLFFSISLGKK